MRTLLVERDTETIIDLKLKNLGYEDYPHAPNRNVFKQSVKTPEQRQKLQGQKPDYTLYPHGSSEPFGIIEAKKVGQDIRQAMEQGLKYANALNAPIVFATDGVFTKTIHAQLKKPLILNGEEIDDLIRESLALQYLTTNEVSTLDKRVIKSRDELISIFKIANNYLRAEGLKHGDERFTEFSNVLFLKLISEIEDIKDELGDPNSTSIIDKEYRWNSFKQKRGKELLSFVNDSVLKEFQIKYEDKNIFQTLQIQQPKTLERIIDELDDLQLTDINADIKGDAFEHFLRSYNAGNKDLGEYFTPRHIVKTMVKLLNPQLGEKIYDPFCGTGGMLIESFKHIKASMPNNTDAFEILKNHTLYGAEITSTSRITKMNMILIGDGHSNIYRKDSLANPVKNQYHVVITNMPFSQSTEYQDLYDISMTGKNNGDSICVQHCLKALKQGGRMGVIVPEGFLFDKKFKKTREYILEKSSLHSVISLPRGVFLPYSGVKANILLLYNAWSSKKNTYYWYFNVKNDGYSLDNHREKIDGDNDLEVVLSERKNLENEKEDKLIELGIRKISIAKIKQDNYNFVGTRQYLDNTYKSNYPLMKFGDVIDLLRGPFGSSIKKSVCVKSGFKIYEQGNVINNDFNIGKYYLDKNRFEILSKFEIKTDDVLITCAGTLGKVAIVPDRFERGIINSVLMRLRIKNKKLIPEYLKYIMESNIMQNEMIDQSLGTSIKNMRAGKELKELYIPLPSIKEQERIVKRLRGTEYMIEKYNLKIKDLQVREKASINSIFNSESQPEANKHTYKLRQKDYLP